MAAVVTSSALLVSACGGRDPHFLLAPTRACLNSQGYRTFTENNWILKPTEGSLGIAFGRQYIEFEFGKNAREARMIRDAARSAGGKNSPIDARANVAYVWSEDVQDRVDPVLRCLRE